MMLISNGICQYGKKIQKSICLCKCDTFPQDDPFKVKGQVNSQIFYFQRLFGKVSALRKIFHFVGYRTAGSAYIAVSDGH